MNNTENVSEEQKLIYRNAKIFIHNLAYFQKMISISSSHPNFIPCSVNIFFNKLFQRSSPLWIISNSNGVCWLMKGVLTTSFIVPDWLYQPIYSISICIYLKSSYCKNSDVQIVWLHNCLNHTNVRLDFVNWWNTANKM